MNDKDKLTHIRNALLRTLDDLDVELSEGAAGLAYTLALVGCSCGIDREEVKFAFCSTVDVVFDAQEDNQQEPLQ